MHTPGEWKIIRGGVFSDALGLAIHSEEGKVIAAGVQLNNAPLIAAAPDLLGACRAASAFLNNIGVADQNPMRKYLASVIRKAEEEL